MFTFSQQKTLIPVTGSKRILKQKEEEISYRKIMPGVIYIQTVPPLFTVKRLREIMVRFGDIGRVYLQAEKRGPHRRKRYTEGWVEFKSKRIAKDVARMLNGQLVGGRRRSAAYDSIWTMKYLHGFKWDHLMEQLAYERRVEQQRLRAEIVQEKRKAEHFSQQVDKGERLKQLEERILKKSGLWERYQQQHQQRQVVQEGKRQRSQRLNEQTGFLQMIFGANQQTEKEEDEEEENDEVIGEDKLGGGEEEEEKDEEETVRDEDEEQMATSLSEDDEESQGNAEDSDNEVSTEKRKPMAQKWAKSADKFKSNDERKMGSSRQKKPTMVRRQKKRGVGGANRSNKRKGHKT